MPVTDPPSQPQAASQQLPAWQRLAPALMRRLRLLWVRLRFPRVYFGARCDIRRGLSLIVASNASVQVGAQCILDRDMTIECQSGSRLEIGERTIFGHHCTIGVAQSVSIGEDCLIAELVSIRDHDHRFDGPIGIPVRDQGAVSTPVQIGNNVWLASKVTVLKGVTIGDNVVVGANAVVTKDLPPNAVAVGIPARVIRYRS